MMRSLYAGVSGLQSHQLRTDVIGNNIANVNTNGFKKGRVNFQDMISQTIQGASKPTTDKGGTNPKQVGLGANVATIDTLMSQGSLQTTGKITDLSVQGEGYFVLRKGDKTFYTRAGNYNVDREKYLVNPANGLKVQGWNSTQDTEGNFSIDNSKTYEDVIVPIGDKFEARSTREVNYKCNLDSRVEGVQNPDAPTDAEKKSGQVHFSSIDVYDKQGKVHKLNITFVKVGINQWQAEVDVSKSVEGSVLVDVGQPNNINRDSDKNDTFLLTFDDNGSLKAVREATANNPDEMASGDLYVNITYSVDNGTLNRIGPRADDKLGDSETVKVNLGEALKYNGVTQQASKSTTKGISQDGYKLGYLEAFNIDQNGIVTGVYTNGQVRELAQIALATFINPGGLEKAGESTYISTNNSGLANISAPDTQGKGKIIAGSLEMSNVDLAEEFTNMIVTQRGFQANSRIITTSDQMLQELLTLKR